MAALLGEIHPLDVARLFPPVELVGPEMFPRLLPTHIDPLPSRALAFDRRMKAADHQDTLLHFFVDDSKLRPIKVSPHRFVEKFAGFAGLVTPDFSVHRSMPPHQRIFQIWASRVVGAYFQSKGLTVIPNIRWATTDDINYALTGIEKHSTVAVSSLGCLRDSLNRAHFIDGLRLLIQQLQPSLVLVHGSTPERVFNEFEGQTRFHRYPSDIENAHKGEP